MIVVTMRWPTTMLAVLLLTAGTSVAQAQMTPHVTTSSNWAGYSVTGSHFQRVSATWKVPTVDCSGGASSSVNWVGLGGYSLTARALEQTGTESDCGARGRASYTAWWEVVPDASHTARLAVSAGDRIVASVAVVGTRVTMRLADTTRGTRFARVLIADVVDVTSAEWVLEAPQSCIGDSASACISLPLANFASSSFANARATSRGGYRGAIGDLHWRTTAIVLTPNSTRGRGPRAVGAGATGASAIPGALAADGGGFAIAYDDTTPALTPSPGDG